QRDAGDDEHVAQIDGVECVPLRLSGAVERLHYTEKIADVVDHDVEPAETLVDLAHQRLYLGHVAHVSGAHQGLDAAPVQRRTHSFNARRIELGERDACAPFARSFGGGAADAGAAASHQGGLSSKADHGYPLIVACCRL